MFDKLNIWLRSLSVVLITHKVDVILTVHRR